MLCRKLRVLLLSNARPLSDGKQMTAGLNNNKDAQKRSRRKACKPSAHRDRPKPSAHLPLWNNNVLTQDTHWPHTSVLDQMIDQGEKQEAKFRSLDRPGNLRYRERDVLHTLQQPGVKAFIDSLEEKYLGSLKVRSEELQKSIEVEHQTKNYPECLMGLDPFSYIREEEGFEQASEEAQPLGVQDMVSTGTLINKVVMRSPIDLAYLVKEEKLSGVSEFFKVYFQQGSAALTARYTALKNKVYDHGISDSHKVGITNTALARELQQIYLKHFELLAAGEWNILLDYMADGSVSGIKDVCMSVDKVSLKSFFSIKHLQDNRKPKVLSQMNVPYDDKTFNQVLVRFDMKVECVEWDEDVGRMELVEKDMVHYVVFERDIKDFLSKFRIIEKVSEEDIKHMKRHKMPTSVE